MTTHTGHEFEEGINSPESPAELMRALLAGMSPAQKLEFLADSGVSLVEIASLKDAERLAERERIEKERAAWETKLADAEQEIREFIHNALMKNGLSKDPTPYMVREAVDKEGNRVFRMVFSNPTKPKLKRGRGAKKA